MKNYLFKENAETDVICLGRLGIDFNCNEINRPLEEVITFTRTVGGSPANIAVGVAKLGLKVGFFGRVSDNGLGRFIINDLKSNDIDTSSIVMDKNAANCLAITEIKSPNDCGGILYRDNVADLNLTFDDIDEEKIRSAKVLLVSGTALAKSPSREATILAIDYARKHGTTVVFDIDYRPYTWNSPGETSIYYNIVCSKCDIIIGTREEFDVVEYLYNKDNISDKESALYWIERGVKLVVVKRGKDGSTAWTEENDEFNSDIFLTEHKKTFGAGDAYASGFISYLIKGSSIEEAMRMGSASASIVVSSLDCSESMPTVGKLTEYIREYTGV